MTEKDLQIQDLRAENRKLKQELEQLKQPKAVVDTGMERLTKRDEQTGFAHYPYCFEKCDGDAIGIRCQTCDFEEKICNKLAEYEDLEEEGLLRRLPCKPGDKIYVIPSETNFKLNIINGYEENNRVYKQEVNEVRFYPSGQYLLTTCEGVCSALERFFGITWFLTEQEAQSALEKMKGE